MNLSFRRISLLAAGVLGAILMSLLLGCAPMLIKHYQLAALDKGIRPAQVEQRLNVTPEAEGAVRVDGKEYWIQLYRLLQGGMISNYYLTYDQERRLIYWGYADEYIRSSDPGLNGVMRILQSGGVALSTTR